ncbi:putative CAAX prenyl protease 2 [Helianthus annuus]|nr:putative CAAX prenyl protease 2 [Helianthus annuus]KAJ0958715.1 putative CAAX prenyl protease 2 [Helianthus annuus]
MYIVAPLTEELVFRASHLNHLLEFYMQQNSSLLKASMVVGFPLGYTLIFRSYASFLFVRTGWS